MSSWNFADVFEVIAEVQPDATAQVQGPRRFTWAQFDARADAVAQCFLDAGLAPGVTVAQLLYSCPEYLESMFAAWKIGLPPVNTNYRYGGDELIYLWDNADVGAVVFHGEFTERIESIRTSVPRVGLWLWVDDGTGPCPSWATAYESVATTAVSPHVVPPWGRSPDDLYLLYTGGTTGAPKGVMWRVDDMFALVNRTAVIKYPEEGSLDDVRTILGSSEKPRPVFVPCAPLMHGTGAIASFGALSAGGCVVTLESRSFSAAELLDTIERERVKGIAIVGEAFAHPLLAALDAEPDRWDISSLRMITSSGVMWSPANKAGLLRHNDRLLLVDTLGSSEAVGMASDVASSKTLAEADAASIGGDGSGATKPASFVLDANTKVLTEDGREVLPGSGESGLIAYRGRVPLGYYKDEAKSAGTFKVIDGARWSMPGDFAMVEADGSLRLLGRGSQCINTGGEKVYPEEPEEALRSHPTVVDAACLGLPDPRWGQRIVALVQLEDGATLDEAALIAHVKTRLAGYKAPKQIFAVATLGRAANGKLDYKGLRADAESFAGER